MREVNRQINHERNKKKKKSSKRSKKSGSLFSTASFGEVDNMEEETKNEKEEDDDEDIRPITFSGKKRSYQSFQKRLLQLFQMR